MSAPPIVGVPALILCVSGPELRTTWPICLRRSSRMNHGARTNVSSMAVMVAMMVRNGMYRRTLSQREPAVVELERVEELVDHVVLPWRRLGPCASAATTRSVPMLREPFTSTRSPGRTASADPRADVLDALGVCCAGAALRRAAGDARGRPGADREDRGRAARGGGATHLVVPRVGEGAQLPHLAEDEEEAPARGQRDLGGGADRGAGGGRVGVVGVVDHGDVAGEDARHEAPRACSAPRSEARRRRGVQVSASACPPSASSTTAIAAAQASAPASPSSGVVKRGVLPPARARRSMPTGSREEDAAVRVRRVAVEVAPARRASARAAPPPGVVAVADGHAVLAGAPGRGRPSPRPPPRSSRAPRCAPRRRA